MIYAITPGHVAVRRLRLALGSLFDGPDGTTAPTLGDVLHYVDQRDRPLFDMVLAEGQRRDSLEGEPA